VEGPAPHQRGAPRVVGSGGACAPRAAVAGTPDHENTLHIQTSRPERQTATLAPQTVNESFYSPYGSRKASVCTTRCSCGNTWRVQGISASNPGRPKRDHPRGCSYARGSTPILGVDNMRAPLIAQCTRSTSCGNTRRVKDQG